MPGQVQSDIAMGTVGGMSRFSLVCWQPRTGGLADGYKAIYTGCGLSRNVSACRQLAQRPALLAAGIPSEPVYSSLSRAGGWRCGRSLPLLW